MTVTPQSRETGQHPQIGVGAVIWRGEELLVIRRKFAPFPGEWSIPGGRQEPGETVVSALLREIREETGLSVTILGLIDVIDAILRDPKGRLAQHYTLIDFSARWVSGEAVAQDDAAALRWVCLAELPRFALWSETQRVIDLSARLHGPLAS